MNYIDKAHQAVKDIVPHKTQFILIFNQPGDPSAALAMSTHGIRIEDVPIVLTELTLNCLTRTEEAKIQPFG